MTRNEQVVDIGIGVGKAMENRIEKSLNVWHLRPHGMLNSNKPKRVVGPPKARELAPKHLWLKLCMCNYNAEAV